MLIPALALEAVLGVLVILIRPAQGFASNHDRLIAEAGLPLLHQVVRNRIVRRVGLADVIILLPDIHTFGVALLRFVRAGCGGRGIGQVLVGDLRQIDLVVFLP